MRIRTCYVFILATVVVGIIGYSYYGELYNYFRDRTPHDLIVASGYDVQAQSSQDLIIADPQLNQLIDPEINTQKTRKTISSRLAQLRIKQQEKIGVPRIIADMSRYMAGQLLQKELVEALQWYQSPLGIKVVSLENLATSLQNYPQQQKLATQPINAQAGRQRIQGINRLVSILKASADRSLAIFPHRSAINLAVAQSHRYGEIATIGFAGRSLSIDGAVDQENQYHQFKTMLHYTYQDLSDDELSRYCEFLSSPVGGKAYTVLSGAFQQALFDAIADNNALIKAETKFHQSLEPKDPIRNIFVRIDKIGSITFPASSNEAASVEPSPSAITTPDGDPVIKEQPVSVEAALNMGFGLEYQVLGEAGTARIPITINLRHPPLQDPETGVVRTESSWKAIPRLGQPSFAFWKFEAPWQLVDGEWVMTISYQGELLAERKFTILTTDQWTVPAEKALVSERSDVAEDIYQLDSFKNEVSSKYLVPGGQQLLFISHDELATWDIHARKPGPHKMQLGSVRSPYATLAIDPQGKSFLAVLSNRRLALCRLDQDGNQIFLDEPTAGYMAVGMAYSASGSTVVSLHDDTIQPRNSNNYDPTVSIIASDKKLPDRTPVTRIWDSSSGESLGRIVDFSMPIIDPAERYVVGVSKGNVVAFHDLRSDKRIFQIIRRSKPTDIGGVPAPIVLLKPSPSGDHVLACSKDGVLLLIDYKTRKILREIQLGISIDYQFARDNIHFDPTGCYFHAEGPFIRIWSIETGEQVCDVKSPNGSVLNLKSLIIDTSHNQIVVSLSYNLLFFDLSSGQLKNSYFDEYGMAGIDSSRQKLVVESAGVLRIFDLTSGEEIEDFGIKGEIYQMNYPARPGSYGQAVVLTEAPDLSFQLWDPFTGQPITDSSLSLNAGALQAQNGVWVSGRYAEIPQNSYSGYLQIMDSKTDQQYSIKLPKRAE